MYFALGAIVVVTCVLGGYAALGGHLSVLWQPFEALIIVGAALGAFIISNPKSVLVRTPEALKLLVKGPRHGKDDYLELLSLLYQVFRIARSRGLLALENHIDDPEGSPFFRQFPGFQGDPHARVFLCDYLRLLSLGSDSPYELDALMEEEIETYRQEREQIAQALQNMADAMPALGIVAAVLGIIKTMGAVTAPPEVLGQLIGGALVGTFLGVWLSYGFVGPMAAALRAIFDAESKYLQCIKAGLLAHLHGCAPAISIEHARKALLSDVRPTFYEVEEATAALPPA